MTDLQAKRASWRTRRMFLELVIERTRNEIGREYELSCLAKDQADNFRLTLAANNGDFCCGFYWTVRFIMPSEAT